MVTYNCLDTISSCRVCQALKQSLTLYLIGDSFRAAPELTLYDICPLVQDEPDRFGSPKSLIKLQLIMTPELTLYYICLGRARQVWDQPDQRRRVLHRGGGGRGGQQARVGEDMLHQEPQRKCRHCKQRFRHVCL